MPTYEYKCDACGYQFDRFQSMSAERIKRCPECGKAKVKRLIGTGAGVIFKGSGFYITDYRDKSYADKAKAESGGGSSEAKPDSKSDTKPAESGAASASATPDAKPAAKSEPAKSEPTPKSETASKSAAKPSSAKSRGGGKSKK